MSEPTNPILAFTVMLGLLAMGVSVGLIMHYNPCEAITVASTSPDSAQEPLPIYPPLNRG